MSITMFAAFLAQMRPLIIVIENRRQGVRFSDEFSLAAVTFPAKIFQILSASGLCTGSNDAKRQIQGGAVKLDGQPITDIDLTSERADALVGKILQVGKKRFKKLVL